MFMVGVGGGGVKGEMALGTVSLVELVGEHVQHAHDEFGGILWVVLEKSSRY